MDTIFNERAKNIFDKISELAKKDITEDEIKKIAAKQIDVLAEHNLTYDQAFEVQDIVHKTLIARAMMMNV